MDTTIFELLPRATIRQDQINKFFQDYSTLKPPMPPVFNSEGQLINETSTEYDNVGGPSNPVGSVSYNKNNGYITRFL